MPEPHRSRTLRVIKFPMLGPLRHSPFAFGGGLGFPWCALSGMNSSTLDIQHTFIRKLHIICGIGKNGLSVRNQTEVHHEHDHQESNHCHHGRGNTRHRAVRLLPVQAEQDQRLLMRSRFLHRMWPDDPEMTPSSWTRTMRVQEHAPICDSPL